MSDRLIELTREGPLALLTIQREDKLNALTAEMVDELFELCRTIDKSDAQVVIITGSGKAFCAGGDIEAWSAREPQDFARRWIRDGHDAFDALTRLRQPVIAVLNGHALGGGLELAVCADYRIVEEQVKFGQPEAGLGIIAGWSGTQRAVRRFGAQTVRRMSVFGELFTAEQAIELRLADQLVPKGEGLEAGRALAQKVLMRAETANELSKMLINAAEGEERERVLEALGGWIASGSEELREGLSAFREKRKPKF
ncbi:MAG: enoyl-CoA hydratase/isomerase family protein [Pseudomonadota bacterium]